MKAVFYDESHLHHNPQMWFYRGVAQKSREVAERAEVMKSALLAAGFEVRAPKDFGAVPLEKVHTKRYLEFLEVAYRDWIALEGTGPEVVANMFPIGKDPGYPQIISGRAAFHMEDLSCPISAGTWRAAYGAAQSAIAAADAVSQAKRNIQVTRFAALRGTTPLQNAPRVLLPEQCGHRCSVSARPRGRHVSRSSMSTFTTGTDPGHLLRSGRRSVRLAAWRSVQFFTVLLGL